MSLVVLCKLALAPALILAVTLVGRRHGPRAAGLLVGLPITSGPLSVLLAYERGPAFAAGAARSGVSGALGVGVFCGAWALAARRAGWAVGLAAGAVGVVAVHLVVSAFPLGLALSGLLALAALGGLATVLLGDAATTGPALALPSWELPLRLVVATAVVAGVSFTSASLGPARSGALASLPLITAVLGSFTHHRAGAQAVRQLLGAVTAGAISALAFSAVVARLLGATSTTFAYLSATAAALVSGVLVAYVRARNDRSSIDSHSAVIAASSRPR